MTNTYSIGVDIGGTNTDIGLVRNDGKIVMRRNIPTNKYFDIEVYLKDITDLIKEMMKENEIESIDGIGICAPNGNYYKCTFSGATNLNFKGDFNVQEIVNKYMNVPVVVSNDANAAAFGEMVYGGGKGMKNFKLSEILKPVIVLTAICLVTSALLAYTNKITAPEIEKQNALAANEARSTVLSEAKDFESAKLNGNEEYFIGKSESGDVIGYVFTTTAKSYGGEIQVMVGIKTDGSVNAVELLQINDTPGLGMNAKNPEFLKLLFDARAKKKKLPYGVQLSNGGPWDPYWEGGVGIECHYDVLKAMGYEVKWVRTGIPDSQAFTFELKKKMR